MVAITDELVNRTGLSLVPVAWDNKLNNILYTSFFLRRTR